MDTYICDISALRYWETPPFVSALLAGSGDAAAFGYRCADLYEGAREQALLEAVPNLLKQTSGRRLNAARGHALNLMAAAPLLSSCSKEPIRIMAQERSSLSSGRLIKSVLWEHEVPSNAFVQITDEVHVARPAFALLQMARHRPLIECLLWASELCGSYASYDAPPTIARHIRSLAQTNKLGAQMEGWRPLVMNGSLSAIWQRPALIGPEDLVKMAGLSDSPRGTRRLEQVAELVVPGAASPFESKAGLLLTMPKKLGGYGNEGMTHNEEIYLSTGSRKLSQRNRCYCDLYWKEGIDVECQSTLVHESEMSFLSDADRTAALLNEGITVLPLTYAQLADPYRFAEFAETLSRLRGLPFLPKTEAQRRAEGELRGMLFGAAAM